MSHIFSLHFFISVKFMLAVPQPTFWNTSLKQKNCDIVKKILNAVTENLLSNFWGYSTTYVLGITRPKIFLGNHSTNFRTNMLLQLYWALYSKCFMYFLTHKILPKLLGLSGEQNLCVLIHCLKNIRQSFDHFVGVMHYCKLPQKVLGTIQIKSFLYIQSWQYIYHHCPSHHCNKICLE
jgi:hypothetical protein